MNIIVIDDEVSSLSLFLNRIIDDSSINCQFFKDSVEAIIDFCRSHEVKGAFIDINMRSIRGDKLAMKLLDVLPSIRFVFVTGTNATMEDLPERVRANTLNILYKPIDDLALKSLLLQMDNRELKAEVKTFGDFECFLGKKPIRFSSNKSKELFALLVVERGKSLNMDRAISLLWPDKDITKAKILYRDAVWRLRKTLEDSSFPCVQFSRASLSIKPEMIRCDYYELLDGKDVYYPGEFLSSYDWSFPFESEIDYILSKRKK